MHCDHHLCPCCEPCCNCKNCHIAINEMASHRPGPASFPLRQDRPGLRFSLSAEEIGIGCGIYP